MGLGYVRLEGSVMLYSILCCSLCEAENGCIVMSNNNVHLDVGNKLMFMLHCQNMSLYFIIYEILNRTGLKRN